MRKHQIENLIWREMVWQRPFRLETVWEVLTHLSAMTPRGAVIWECRGSNGNVAHLLGADRIYIGKIEQAFRAHGDVQFHDIPYNVRTPVKMSRQLKITHPVLSLNTDVTAAVIRAGLAALTENKRGVETVIQVVLGRGFAPSPTPADLPDPNASWLNVLFGSVSKASAEDRKTVRQKADQHGFQAAIRIGVSDERATARLRSLLSALKILESAGVRIHDEAEDASHLNHARIPWHFPLQRLSVKELANFLLLPAGDEELPGTPGLHPKLTLPPAFYRQPTDPQNDRSFAVSMDIMPQKLSISPKDSLEHTHLIGPTGSGKSTAMQHLILADIKANRSVLVLDPKADLVNDILARIPEERADDVVVIDPSDSSPCGFNPLAFKDYGDPALLADSILSVMKEIFSDSWGIRTADILNAALLTLVNVENATLLWLPALLTDEAFRMKIVSNLTDRVALLPFWEQFNTLKDSERRQHVDPVLNKLLQFLLRPGLRNILGQAKPKFTLTDLFSKRRIVLVPLNRGLIGGESARLIGSLIVGLTWTLALSRAKLPPERRYLVSLYIDELQDYLSLPTDLSDALAQARGLGLGLTLAHQYRDQLPPDIRAGIDANARNKISFGLSAKDAKDMAAMAPELSAEDFIALPRYQIYTSFQQGGRNTGWILGKTLPPMPPLRDPLELRARSMTAYGKPAKEVDEEYLKMFAPAGAPGKNDGDTPIGRRKRS
jgi:Type IV secretory pathway, VirD4 components